MTRGARGAASLVFASILFLFAGGEVRAQGSPLFRLEIPSSFNVVGSGAEVLGMGGAGISLVEDATAASWNPGALVWLPAEKPEFSAVLGYVLRTEENEFGAIAGGDEKENASEANLNYLSFLWPFQMAGRKSAVSINYQHLFDFERSWDLMIPQDEPFTTPIDVDYDQEGDLYALGLAFAMDLCGAEPSEDGENVGYRLTAGVTVNYWGDFIYENKWKQKYTYAYGALLNNTALETTVELEDEYEFEGVNFNLGFLWRIGHNFKIGGVFKTPFTADIRQTSKYGEKNVYPGNPGMDTEFGDSSRGPVEELRMPMSCGIGVSYSYENSRFGLDVFRTEWNDFEYRNSDGTKTSPISGKPMGESDVDATTWVRLGYVYSFEKSRNLDKSFIPGHATKLRAGLFYDPAPAEGSPDDFYGCSLGLGWVYKGISMDFAYQFRYGNDVGRSALQNLDFSQDVYEHAFFMSVVYEVPWFSSE